MLCMVWHK